MNNMFGAIDKLFESGEDLIIDTNRKLEESFEIDTSVVEPEPKITPDMKPYKILKGRNNSEFSIYKINESFYGDDGVKLSEDEVADLRLDEDIIADMKNKAESILKAFENSDKSVEMFTKSLNDISRLNWGNEIDNETYQEYIKKIQEVYKNKNKELVTESMSEDEYKDAIAKVAEYNKYLDQNPDDEEVLGKTMRLIHQIDRYMEVNDPDSFIVPYDIPTPILNKHLDNKNIKSCPYCTGPITPDEYKVFGMCKNCYDNGVE